MIVAMARLIANEASPVEPLKAMYDSTLEPIAQLRSEPWNRLKANDDFSPVHKVRRMCAFVRSSIYNRPWSHNSVLILIGKDPLPIDRRYLHEMYMSWIFLSP